MKLINFYNLLFFHIYQSILKSGDRKTPVATAILVLSVIEFFNLLSLLLIVDMTLFDVMKVFDLFNRNLLALFIGGVIFILNLLFLYSNNRYYEIICQYSNRLLSQRKKGARITFAYGLGSILLVFILAPLRHHLPL